MEKMIFRRSELLKMGYPPELLERAYRTRGQRVAFKINPMKKNSPLMFDLGELKNFIEKQERMDEARRM